ncbi:hypothetical protein AOLI_G00041490 [Acnodon oligacanthus]
METISYYHHYGRKPSLVTEACEAEPIQSLIIALVMCLQWFLLELHAGSRTFLSGVLEGALLPYAEADRRSLRGRLPKAAPRPIGGFQMSGAFYLPDTDLLFQVI